MRMFLRVLISTVMFVASSPAAAAEQSPDFYQALEMLSDSNKGKPWQNPGNERAQGVLQGNVLDQKNKVIGEVRDLLLTSGGAIAKIEVHLNRLRLEPLTADYTALGLQAVSSGYQSKFTDKQIKDMYPALLAGVETASGAVDTEFSLRRILGAPLKAEDGRVLGIVTDVVFDDFGRRATYLTVNTSGRNMARRDLAIPFTSVRYAASNAAHPLITMSSPAAAALAEYSAKH